MKYSGYVKVALYKKLDPPIHDRINRLRILQNILEYHDADGRYFNDRVLVDTVNECHGVWDRHYDFGHVYFAKESDATMFLLRWS